MTEKSIVLPQGEVFYWMSLCHREIAKTIFFMHGLTADHTLFEKQTEYFSAEFSVIAWDAPAHAKSRPYRGFSYDSAADNIKAILDKENISRAIFVGQSMGGFHIQALIKKHPSLVEAFVAIDSCPFGLNYYTKLDLWMMKNTGWMMKCYPEKLLKKTMVNSSAETPYGRQNFAKSLNNYSKKELCHLSGIGLGGFPVANDDIAIKCPTIILVGENDNTGKTKFYCEEWHKKTGFIMHLIPDAAHNANADNPEKVNSIIHDFIISL